MGHNTIVINKSNRLGGTGCEFMIPFSDSLDDSLIVSFLFNNFQALSTLVKKHSHLFQRGFYTQRIDGQVKDCHDIKAICQIVLVFLLSRNMLGLYFLFLLGLGVTSSGP